MMNMVLLDVVRLSTNQWELDFPVTPMHDRVKAGETLGSCRLSRRQHLVRGPAGQLDHMIVLEGKGAYPRRCRAQFDDQRSDFAFRQMGLDRVPPRPAFPRIEAQKLP